MKTFKITVYVFRKTECNNPEEPTTLAALHRLELEAIKSIRMGRCFLLSVEAKTEIDARMAAETACKKLLANLVMERFEIASVQESELTA